MKSINYQYGVALEISASELTQGTPGHNFENLYRPGRT